MNLSPYTAIDGIPTFKDSFIKGIFERMEDEGLIGQVFSDGSIKSSDDFLRIMKFGQNSLYVIFIENDVAGCCWLNGFEKRKADFHFCFFANLRGEEAVEIGRQVVIQLLNMENVNGDPIFDVLVGMVSEKNIAALRWCEKMKFGTLGVLPAGMWDEAEKRSVSGHVFYAERSQYGKGQ
ncbi:MAG: hypothetical protein A4E71_00100 [Smithella sp. PtaU1.Bin162]|nr:MAG: hypothetical protein A4E71_00100 [Smithella sp. PtaU1.Bin162]